MSLDAVPRTLQDVVSALPRLARRRAVGLHSNLALRWWTYARLYREILGVARYLRDHGVGRGDRLILWAPNSPEWVAVFFGAALRGAVAVLIDSDVTAETVADIASREHCSLVFCAIAHPERGDAGSTSWVPLTSLCGGESDATFEDVALLIGEDDPVALLFSSGTTASPKGVLLSHRNVTCQVEPFRRWRGLLSWLPIRMLVLPPASHVLGLVVGLVLPLTIGLSIVYTAGARATGWARVLRDHRIVIALAVPRVLHVLERYVRSAPIGRGRLSLDTRLHGAGRWGRMWWPFWARGEVLGRPFFHLFIVGGAHLPSASARFWRHSGVLVVEGYGLAETAAIVSLSNPFSFSVGNVGRPSGTRHVELAADGEIFVRGPHVALSSRDNEERAAASSGLVATGDLGRFDRRGRLTIVGRKKEVIVTAEGFNVHPDEVEMTVVRQPGVLDGVVVSTTTDAGEEVHAVLRLAPDAEPAAVIRNANAELAEHQRVRSWTVWPAGVEIPRNRMGKVRRSEVAARLSQVHGEVERQESSETVTLAHVVGERDRSRRLRLLARHVVQAAPSSAGADLRLAEDLGLSSLDIVELLALVEGSDSRPSLSFVPPGATVGDLRAQVGLQRCSDVGGQRASARGTAGLKDGGDEDVRRARADLVERTMAGFDEPSGPAVWTLPLQVLQPVTRAMAIAVWAAFNAVIDVHWEIDPRRLDCPFLLAAAPHRHWLDAFVIDRALPHRFRRRLHLLVEHDFSEHFRPDPDTPLRSRLWIAFAYYLGLPALFPFTLLKPHGRTREALFDAARRIDRGRILLSFPKGLSFFGNPEPDRHALGIAKLAIESGRPILPVHLESRHASFGWQWHRPRQRIGVFFGVPVQPAIDAAPENIAAAVETSFARLRDLANRATDN